MASFYASYPVSGGGGGVSVYATFSAFPAGTSAGQLAVAADTGDLYEWNGSAWQLIGGPGAVLSIGTIDSEVTPSANGATITANALILQSASATVPGLVNNTTQSFAGQKTFTTGLTGTLTGSASLNVLTSALGTLTETTSSVLTLSGWTDATVGSPTITVKQATTSVSGYLSSTDWNTFNGKQAAGNYITALTGDATASGPSGGGSAALTLATVNTNTGTFASVTVNGKGLVTAAAALTGDITSSGSATTLATVNSSPGTYAISSVTVNGKGLITAASAASTTGSGNVVLATSPTLVTPVLGTPSSGTLTSCTGLPVGGIAAIATDTIVGNNTGGSASPTALTIAQVNTLLGTLSNPMTTLGDIIYENATPAPARLAGNTTSTVNFLGQTGNGTISAAPAWTAFTAPTVQAFTSTGTQTGVLITVANTTVSATAGAVYTNNSNNYTLLNSPSSSTGPIYFSGSGTTSGLTFTKSSGTGPSTIVAAAAINVQTLGTYTTPTSPRSPVYIKVRAVGGGGGGGASNSSGSTGVTGGSTVFGTSLFIANGGVGGTGGATNSAGGIGGTASITTSSSVIQLVAVSGGGGQAGLAEASYTAGYVVYAAGGIGGSSAFGGGGYSNSIGGVGGAGATNSGGGGGGGGLSSAANAGAGGGSGGYAEGILTSPGSTYYYSIGASGAGGSGAGGIAGGAGGSGYLVVEEFYQ